MPTEIRYFRAYVRKDGAIGRFYPQDFAVTVTVQGSYGNMLNEAVAGIREQGYETEHIVSHSAQRECL